MQAATQDSVATIQEISATINLMSEISSTIADAVEEQGAAMQEIARNVQLAAQRSGEVAQSISDVSRDEGETGAASGQVLSPPPRCCRATVPASRSKCRNSWGASARLRWTAGAVELLQNCSARGSPQSNGLLMQR